MGRKLLRFMTILGVVAVLFGMWLLTWGVDAKAVLDAGDAAAGAADRLPRLVRHAVPAVRKQRKKTRSHVWFRWFNEAPVLLTAIVVLVIVKPF